MIIILEKWDDWENEMQKRIVLQGEWHHKKSAYDIYFKNGCMGMENFITFLKEEGFVEVKKYEVIQFPS